MLPIAGIQKTSLIDFPERISTIFFTPGCNFRCSYCHNPQLVNLTGDIELFPKDFIIKHLNNRRRVLDGVVITGGEPTLYGEKLIEFIKIIKDMGYLVKLDTNGSNPEVLKTLIADNLVDYIAMDIKTSLDEYYKFINDKVDIAKISESIDLLKSSFNLKLIELEFRTTLHPLLHTEKDFEQILNLIAGSPLYVIQTFNNQVTLDSEFNKTYPFTEDKMKQFQKLAQKFVGKCLLRD